MYRIAVDQYMDDTASTLEATHFFRPQAPATHPDVIHDSPCLIYGYASHGETEKRLITVQIP